MLIAFSVAPSGTGDSVADSVAEAVRVVRESGLPNRTDSMFTTIEGEWDECLDVVRRACEAVGRDGQRVSLVLKADIRPGRTGEMQGKVERLEAALERGAQGAAVGVTTYGVRPVQPGDADALGVVHIRVWREAYAGLMPAEYLARLSVERSQQRWRTTIADPAPGTATVVGLADGQVVGFATAGRSRDEPADPASELWVVNLLAAHHGTGLARRLVDAAFEGAGIAAADAVSLWVARGNERACAFYRRLGFAPDGRTTTHEPTGAVEERWVRPSATR